MKTTKKDLLRVVQQHKDDMEKMVAQVAALKRAIWGSDSYQHDLTDAVNWVASTKLNIENAQLRRDDTIEAVRSENSKLFHLVRSLIKDKTLDMEFKSIEPQAESNMYATSRRRYR